jgi:hypothetical protein
MIAAQQYYIEFANDMNAERYSPLLLVSMPNLLHIMEVLV